MENQYNKIPEHLYEYRRRINLTQVQFSQMWDLTQNYYTELESGRYRLTYENLIHFAKNGGDVGYIITGKETHKGIVEKYITNCRTDLERLEILRCIQLLTQIGCDFSRKDERARLGVLQKYVKFVENEISDCTIWENIRYIEGMTQVQMAALLDIQVKTYRKIEKMQKGPGAEILQIMYQRLGYSPWLFIDRKRYHVTEINEIWDNFPEQVVEDLEAFLKSMIKIIEKYEISCDDEKCITFRG